MKRFIAGQPIEEIEPVCSRGQLLEMQEAVKAVSIHDDLVAYSVDLVDKTRTREEVALGVSRGEI